MIDTRVVIKASVLRGSPSGRVQVVAIVYMLGEEFKVVAPADATGEALGWIKQFSVRFTDRIEQAMKYFCPLADSSVSGCDVITTNTGNALPFPVSDDTGNVATIVGEASSVSELDATANQITLGAYKITSGLVKASLELLQDSAFDVEDWLAGLFGERFGRGLEAYFTTGSGSSQPTGILNAIESTGWPG